MIVIKQFIINLKMFWLENPKVQVKCNKYNIIIPSVNVTDLQPGDALSLTIFNLARNRSSQDNSVDMLTFYILSYSELAAPKKR